MRKSDEICEFDRFDFSDIPKNPNPITKEEEDRLISEMKARIEKRKAEQESREAWELLENKTKNAVSISVTTAPNVSIMEQSR